VRTTTLPLFALPLFVAACNRTPPELIAPAPAARPADTSAAPAAPAAPERLTRPTVEIPPGAPPTSLTTTDLVVGTGPEARAGQRVEVQYTGVAWSTKRQFDSSWDRGERPFGFTLGSGQVIRGWDQGVAGMRVGGRRRLVIPPDLGYGAAGAGRDIGPNETLVFVVDLVAVR
jgi:peptidylprolyl isomerase